MKPTMFVIFLLAAAGVHAQTQTVAGSSDVVFVSEGTDFTVGLQYSADPAATILPGIGFRVHYDSTVLELVPVMPANPPGLANPEGLAALSLANSDIDDNYDGDISTDSFASILMTTLDNDFPATIDPLYSLTFRPLPGLSVAGGSTTINITPTAIAPGHTFVGRSIDVVLGTPSMLPFKDGFESN